jgi:hypothetical protein
MVRLRKFGVGTSEPVGRSDPRCSHEVFAPNEDAAQKALEQLFQSDPVKYAGATVSYVVSHGAVILSDEAIAAIAAAMQPPAPEPTPEPEQALPEDEFVFDRK